MAEHGPAKGRYIGQPLPRREDPRLLRGEGLYVADVDLPDMACMAVVRSPHAHARVLRVDISGALAQPGVLAAISFADLENPQRLPMLVPHKALRPRMPYPLVEDVAQYVGEPVAAIVAETQYQAEDAVDHVEVEYEPLPAVMDAEAGLAPDAPLVHLDAPDNVAAAFAETVGDPNRAFAEADAVLRFTIRFGRASGQPMETRGVVARYERTKIGESLTMWDSTQAPHTMRRVLAGMLGMPLHAVRVIAPEVGGGFGIKNRFYPEEYLVPYFARRLGRPVRWIEDRREDFLTTYQAREQTHHLEVAARKDGTILGIRDRIFTDQGPYTPFGLVVSYNAMTTLPGPYRLRSYQADVKAVFTNKSAMAPYRAAGRPPAVFAIERSLDLVARHFGLDPAEVRQRNFVQPDEFPYTVGLPDRDGTSIVYDSGSYPACLTRALEMIDADGFRREQAAGRAEGRYLGLGIGCYVESTGRGPFEGSTVRVDNQGKVTVLTGATPNGQSHETTLAQVCAERLGVPIEDVTVVTGDTAGITLGFGSYASRTAVLAGSATSAAALSVREKALRVGAQLLEASPDDLELKDGAIRVVGAPDRKVTLAQVARVVTSPSPNMAFPEDLEPGLEATNYFRPDGTTFANGAHVATIEVDAETGQVTILKYVVVHDCGTVINPKVVDGQVVGGVSQGIGNALLEELVYDEDGQLLTTSYMDYLLPTAVEIPTVGLGHMETPSPLNPEGIKGAGEGGTMPVPAVIANAIDDALAPLGIEVKRIPIGPSALRALIRERQPVSLSEGRGRG